MIGPASAPLDGAALDGRDGARPAPTTTTTSFGVVFVLAGGGLRHMARPKGSPDGSRRGAWFLGYPREELFWKDLLDLAHPEESEGIGALVRDVAGKPGTSVSVKLRLLDASGRWRWVEASVQNVIEAPDAADATGGGLLVVNVRDLSPFGG